VVGRAELNREAGRWKKKGWEKVNRSEVWG
jgi:hypothetical protein